MIIESNRALLQHFSKMAVASQDEAHINLDFVESLLKNGADINAADRYGQTVLHEAARAWHTDVARWLLERGCDVNKWDNYGRTALHTAAAVDSPEIVNLLLDWGADKEVRTMKENQTPVFYAARSDATNSMKGLIKRGCQYKLIRDYKARTPIHVAAELVAVFWMTYGGTKKAQHNDSEEVMVEGYSYPAELVFSLFRLTLVDDYDYTAMKAVDNVFTDVILTVWFFLSSILCLNLFIALLSDTFQRVYDNTHANAVMQNALTILNIWDGLSSKRKRKFYDYVEHNCSPLTEYYDDDLTTSGDEDLKKVTFQIKDQLEDFREAFKHTFADFSEGSLLERMETLEEKRNSTHGSFKREGNQSPHRRCSFVSAEQFESEISVVTRTLLELQDMQMRMADRYDDDMEHVRGQLKQLVNRATVEQPVEETCASPKKQKSEFSQVDNIRHSSVQETLIMKEHTPRDSQVRKKRKVKQEDMSINVENLATSLEIPSSLNRKHVTSSEVHC